MNVHQHTASYLPPLIDFDIIYSDDGSRVLELAFEADNEEGARTFTMPLEAYDSPFQVISKINQLAREIYQRYGYDA